MDRMEIQVEHPPYLPLPIISSPTPPHLHAAHKYVQSTVDTASRGLK
ncbi:hypothetical protein CVT24_001799 [Panaeolus cyanescens]|uniref:Uncharacterized protein n=1 Tax=Panaeolus cyanescens TaxID=181874 RepID=A0A409YU66_9AGAR|nr:hypothetical protein CVT24_001799 [Panaeolus cyanescens]